MRSEGSTGAGVIGGDYDRGLPDGSNPLPRLERKQCAKCRGWFAAAKLSAGDWCRTCLRRFGTFEPASEPAVPAARQETEYDVTAFAEPPAAIEPDAAARFLDSIPPGAKKVPAVQVRRDTITGRWWVNSPTGTEPFDTWADAIAAAHGNRKPPAPARRPDSKALADAYAAGATYSELIDRFGVHSLEITAALREHDVPAHPRSVGAQRIKARLAAHGITARELRVWADANGVDCPSHGVVPTRVVEAWETAQGRSSS